MLDPKLYQQLPSLLLQAALQRLDGTCRSNDRNDVQGVCDLCQWFHDTSELAPEQLARWVGDQIRDHAGGTTIPPATSVV